MPRFDLQEFLRGSFPRYLLVGVGMSLLDLALFSVFAVLFGLHEVPANVISTVVTVLVSYQLNRRFVFTDARSGWRAFFAFAGVTLVTGMIIQSAVIWGVVALGSGLAPGVTPEVLLPAAKIIAMGFGALCNYFGYRFILRPGSAQNGA